MAFKQPNSMEECLYFTRRDLDNGGYVIAWVFRKLCPKCKKSLMGKPLDEKGKVKIRAKEYVCRECGYSESKEEHEKSRVVYVKYKCPYCGYEGETTTEYKRKNFKGIPSYIFTCQKCGKKIAITKKLK